MPAATADAIPGSESSKARQSAGVRPGALVVPEPVQRWFSADQWLPEALRVAERPPEAAGARRAIGPEPLRSAGSFAVIAEERLDRLRGPKPALPYRIPSPPDQYGIGLDVSARGGLLSYAPDTTPLVRHFRR